MNRRDFIAGGISLASAFALSRSCAQSHDPTGIYELDARQREIDAVTPGDFAAYWKPGSSMPAKSVAAYTSRFPAIARLESAFEKVVSEVKETVVTDLNRPAVWYLYNMGVIVKTPKTLFSIDLHHRRAEEFAPMPDFALVTHSQRSVRLRGF